jgi:hypothetical protein
MAAGLIRELYEFDCVGGCAHIVTDDWNLEDDNIEYCLNYCKGEDAKERYENEDAEFLIGLAETALEALKFMTEPERASAIALAHGYWSTNGKQVS